MNAPHELVIASFQGEKKAAEVLDAMKKWSRESDVRIENAAVLVKDKDGHAHISQKEDVSAGSGALFGAITGGLIGLLGGPAGVAVGAAAGAATGGAAAATIDFGFPKDQLKALENSLPRGNSALVMLLEHTWAERVKGELRRYPGQYFHQPLSADIASRYGAEEDIRRR